MKPCSEEGPPARNSSVRSALPVTFFNSIRSVVSPPPCMEIHGSLLTCTSNFPPAQVTVISNLLHGVNKELQDAYFGSPHPVATSKELKTVLPSVQRGFIWNKMFPPSIMLIANLLKVPKWQNQNQDQNLTVLGLLEWISRRFTAYNEFVG